MVITGSGYDMSLKSKPPFMYIENEQYGLELKGSGLPELKMGVIAYGAFNARGLIGPEQGGVGIVAMDSVMATKAVPYRPDLRQKLLEETVRIIRGYTEREDNSTDTFLCLLHDLNEAGYHVRAGINS